MSELDDRELEAMTAGKDVREQALTALRSADRAAKSLDEASRKADREIGRLGKSLGL
jgi:hypothetical protein